ncbi:hypothetical protein RYX53_16565, partial [Alkalibacillus haloalkaliphilus]
QTGTEDDYVAEIKVLAGKSKNTDDSALTEYFQEGLQPKLLGKLMDLENVPKTIDQWYDTASRFDNQWRKASRRPSGL